jgi:hypothetical protein
MASFEIIVSAVDRASGVMRGIASSGQGAARSLATNWRAVALAGASAGIAVEALARKMAPTNESIARLAASTDMTEGEVRKLTASLVNATFPLADVNALLDVGRRRGLQSAEALEEYAKFWDMVGDATGEGSAQLAEAAVALGAVGIKAGEEGQALSAFGFITQNTTASIGEFLNFVGRVGPDLSEMGVSVDDAAAILGALEEKGLSGRVAITQFNQAVNESEGDLDALLSQLGLTGAKLDEYRGKVAASSGVIQTNAKANNDQFTAVQKMQALWTKGTVLAGGYIRALSGIAPLLMALGPAIKAVTTAKSIWLALQTKLNIALLANPIGIVIIAVAALGTAAVALVKNWDTVGPFFRRMWEGIVAGAKWGVNMVIKYINLHIAALERLINAAARAASLIPGINIPRVSLPRVPELHGGGIYRAPQPGGQGLAMLRDGERVLTAGQQSARGSGVSAQREIRIDQRGLFAGANIRMTSREDARAISEEIFALTRTRLRAEGVYA